MSAAAFLRPFVLFSAGLVGAAGVGLAAAASHGGDSPLLTWAATIALAHAPALLALHAGARFFRTAIPGALLILLGTLLFAGDMVLRQYVGEKLFPMAAPTGGTTMILGWVVVALGAFFPLRDGRG